MAAPNTTWQRIVFDIAERIHAGETPVGSKIASYRQLVERNNASLGTVKHAVEYLQDAGVLRGVQGSGVFVLRTPDDDMDFTTTADDIPDRISRLEESLAKLQGDGTDLREIVGLLQTHLVELYARLGQPYPRSGSADRRPQQQPRRKAANG